MSTNYNIRGVTEEAQRKAKMGAAGAGQTTGQWVSAALEMYFEKQVEGMGVLKSAAKQAKEPEHEDFFPDAQPVMRITHVNEVYEQPEPEIVGQTRTNADIRKPVKKDPAKIPGVTRGAKEPLWKNKKKKALL